MSELNKTILITGGLGFIGSSAAIHFYKLNYKIVIIDNLSRPYIHILPKLKKENSSSGNYNFLTKNYPKIKIIRSNICNQEDLSKIFHNEKPYIVIHAAGQTSAIGSIKNPTKDFKDNVVGLFNTIECARKENSTKIFLYLSTNKVYGSNPNNIELIETLTRYSPNYSEKEEFTGISERFQIDDSKHTPYGVSKLSGDLYVQEYGRLYDLHTVVFRLSCIYGPKQIGILEQGWISHLIIKSIVDNEITIFGTGKQVRDILYIDDLLAIFGKYIKYINNIINIHSIHQSSSVYNVGGGLKNSISLLEFLDIVKKCADFPLKIIIKYDEWRPADQKWYISDISKVKKELDWNPKVSPENGIKQTFNWLKNWLKK